MKAVIYTRVSSEGQEDGTSLASQFAACARKALELGMDVVAHFEEIETGAFYLGRSKLQSALEMIEGGEAQALIFYALDRFSRDREHQETIKKRIERAGGKLIFCTQDFADTPEGGMMFGVTGAFANYEREVIRRRMMNGRNGLIAKGLMPMRSFRPYGYELIRKNDARGRPPGTYIIIEAEAQIVREIFQRYRDGDSLTQLCYWLQSNGTSTMTGAPWGVSTISKMIKNTIYSGTCTYGRKKAVTDETRKERGLKSKYNVRRDPAEHQYITVPAIVSTELFQAANDRLALRLRMGGRKDRRYLLTGLIKCAGCGRALTGTHLNDGRYFYRCAKSDIFSRACPGTLKHHIMSTLDSRVIDVILHVVSNPQLTGAAYDQYVTNSTQATASNQAGNLRKELTELKKRERALIESQISAKIAGTDGSTYEEMISVTSKRRAAIETQLSALQCEMPSREAVLQTYEQFTEEAIANIRTVLNSDKIENHVKNQLIGGIISKVVPESKTNIRVYFHTQKGWQLVAAWNNGEIKLTLEQV